MRGGIYLILLSETHYYIGRTKCFEDRKRVHLRRLKSNEHWNAHAQSVFNANRKFEFYEMMEVPVELQVEIEGVCLSHHFGKPGCLNLTPSPLGQPLGYRASEETRAKLRAHRHTPETKAKCAESGRKPRRKPIRPFKPISSETLEKRSISLKKAWEKRKESGPISSAMKGKTHSEDSKRKMSEGSKRVWDERKLDPNYDPSDYLGNNTGCKYPPRTEEWRKNHSEAMKKNFAEKGHPESFTTKGTHRTQEQKDHHSRVIKEIWARKKAEGWIPSKKNSSTSNLDEVSKDELDVFDLFSESKEGGFSCDMHGS